MLSLVLDKQPGEIHLSEFKEPRNMGEGHGMACDDPVGCIGIRTGKPRGTHTALSPG